MTSLGGPGPRSPQAGEQHSDLSGALCSERFAGCSICGTLPSSEPAPEPMASLAFGAAASAVGIGAGTIGVAAPYKQAHDLFRQQINQDRRFFVADWAETSWRHSEALAQAERQHAEGYMLNLTQYWQADKIHRREFRQSMMIHQREVDIMLRAETREALRDELLFQNNRMNNVQLCDTVCLGVAFTIAVEGVLPEQTSSAVISLYAACIGAAILLLASSLWLSFILIRRLNLYTAGIMHAMIDMERLNVRPLPPPPRPCCCSLSSLSVAERARDPG